MSRLSKCLAALATATVATAAQAQDFKSLVAAQPVAQLYQVNAEALDVRLSLLDNAQPGGTVKIATFVFDYGVAVKRLAAHTCRAANRGVQVELIVDSKAGEQVDQDNAFDAKEEAKKAEEVLQFMTNCGVKVFVHNDNLGWVSILGKRLPNLFNRPNGSSIGPLDLLSRVKQMKAKLVSALTPALQRQGVTAPLAPLLDNVQGLVLEIASLNGVKISGSSADSAHARIGSFYRAIVNDPIWDQLDPLKMKAVTLAVQDALKNDPELLDVFTVIRRHNRLNHRKIFLATGKDGEGCALIGGRNLGDHYLVNSKDNFRDADVMVCHPQAGGSEFLGRVNHSFEQLKNEFGDYLIGPEDNQVRQLTPNPRYQYKYINAGEITVKGAPLALPKGIKLAKFENPVLLTSNWSHAIADQVRIALLTAILKEQKEIYIETAYAEFNSSLRRAIERALQRGVRVRIMTNSMFISDGPSKVIRLWMAEWNARMAAMYPKLFTVYYATLEAGHMIHFKGAGFRCQKDTGGSYSRFYMIGSHNFHPRSGYSDKENSLSWTEPTTSDCSQNDGDLIDERIKYWNLVSKGTKAPVLYANLDLRKELSIAAQFSPKSGDGALARALLGAMFRLNPKINDFEMYQAQRLQHILFTLEEGGMRDLIGILF